MANLSRSEPVYGKKVFVCAVCQEQSSHYWNVLMKFTELGGSFAATRDMPESPHLSKILIAISVCYTCGQYTIWRDERIVDPQVIRDVEAPHPDMPEDVRELYDEAASVLSRSSRAATALVRVALQRMCKHLGEEGKNINADIASLTLKGLDATVVDSLDVVRLLGNGAAHPEQMILDNTLDDARATFFLLNYIVDEALTRSNNQKVARKLAAKLSEKERLQIQERNRPLA